MQKKPKSLCRENGGCLSVRHSGLGQKETSVGSSLGGVVGGKNEVSWAPSAPWNTQNWMLKVTYGISCCDLYAEYWVLAFG